jgi:hypothetical protein
VANLTNADHSDLELLHLIDDIAKRDRNGYVLADDVIEALSLNGNGRTAVSRMAWMNRLGYLDKIEASTLDVAPGDRRPRYLITDEGRALIVGRLNAAVQKALAKADPGTSLLVMREIAERSYVNGSRATANATRRQWLHTAAKRSGR